MNYNECENFLIGIDQMKSLINSDGPIYVVDDDVNQHLIIENCYQRAKRDNDLICFSSGEEFILNIKDILTSEVPLPEVIFLDINMPKMDGFDVLKTVRELEGDDPSLRIIMCTTSFRNQDQQLALKLAANGYFSKPLYVTNYIELFRQL